MVSVQNSLCLPQLPTQLGVLCLEKSICEFAPKWYFPLNPGNWVQKKAKTSCLPQSAWQRQVTRGWHFLAFLQYQICHSPRSLWQEVYLSTWLTNARMCLEQVQPCAVVVIPASLEQGQQRHSGVTSQALFYRKKQAKLLTETCRSLFNACSQACPMLWSHQMSCPNSWRAFSMYGRHCR